MHSSSSRSSIESLKDGNSSTSSFVEQHPATNTNSNNNYSISSTTISSPSIMSRSPSLFSLMGTEPIRILSHAFVSLAVHVITHATKNDEDTKCFLITYRKHAVASDLLNIWIGKCRQLRDKKSTQKLDCAFDFLYVWYEMFSTVDFGAKVRYGGILEILKEFPFTTRINEFKLLMIRTHRTNQGVVPAPAPVVKESGGRLQPSITFTTSSHTPALSLSLNSVNSANSHSISSAASNSSNEFNNASPSSLRKMDVTEGRSSDMLKISSNDLCHALTNYESMLFMKVHMIEFMTRIGWAPKKQASGKILLNADRLAAQFNQVSMWVVTEILTRHYDKNAQKLALEKVITIAKKCVKIGNYNTALAILSGLNHFTIHRLKSMWDGLPERIRLDYAELEDLMSPVSNFKKYYEDLATRRPPLVPYFGLYLRDFTFFGENDIFLADGSINFDLVRMIGKRLLQIRALQTQSFNLPTHLSSEFASSLHFIEYEEELHRLSLISEPSMFASSLTWDDSASRYSTESRSMNGSPYESEEDFSDTSSVRSGESELSQVVSGASANRLSGEAASPKDAAPTKPATKNTLSVSEVKRHKGHGSEETHGNAPERDRKKKHHSRNKSGTIREKKIRCHVVSVPDFMAPPFAASEKQVDKYFSNSQMNLEKGIIHIYDERYILVRAASLAYDFLAAAKQIFNLENEVECRDFSRNFLYRLAFNIGSNDMKLYKTKMNLESNMEMLSAGPVHFAYTGWASVTMCGDSVPVADDKSKVQLHWYNMFSFESHSWKNCSSEQTEFSVCSLGSGYAAGWCTQALGIEAVGCEIQCSAKGDKHCEMVLADRSSISRVVDRYCGELKLPPSARQQIFIPGITEAPKPNQPTEQKTDKNWFSKGIKTLKTTSNKAKVIIPSAIKADEHEKLKIDDESVKTIDLFGKLNCVPNKAEVRFAERPDDRFLFVRPDALSVEFFSEVRELFGQNEEEANKFASLFLFDLGRNIGGSDVTCIVDDLEMKNPVDKLYLLPGSFQRTGWGKGSISEDSVFLCHKKTKAYHIYSKFHMEGCCEASSWANNNQLLRINPTSEPSSACVLTSGYISGWASSSFGTKVVAIEMSCKVNNGGAACQFLLTTQERAEESVKKWLTEAGKPVTDANNILGLQLLKQKYEGFDKFAH